MVQSSKKDVLSEEIKSWKGFEYALREENRLLFSKMLSECGKNDATSKLMAIKMNSSLLNHCYWYEIRQIYPTKLGGEEWFMNMQNPIGDPRFDPQATITKNPDGSYKVTKEEIRMEVHPSTGYHQDKINTLNQKE